MNFGGSRLGFWFITPASFSVTPGVNTWNVFENILTTTLTTTTTTTAAPVITTTTAAPVITTTTAAPVITTTTAAPVITTTTAAPVITTTTTPAPIGPLGFNNKNYGFIKSTAGVAKLTLRFFDNGIWQIIPSNTGNAPVPQNDLSSWALVTGNWYTPQTAGIGSGYLYRVQTTSISINGAGTVFPDNTNPGTWLPFTATGNPELASAAITAGGSDEAFGDFTVEIAINNGGTAGTIVSTSILSLNGSRGA
jgi:hypothetical protein